MHTVPAAILAAWLVAAPAVRAGMVEAGLQPESAQVKSAAIFTDVTAGSGIPALRYSEGVNATDIDGDGLPELYLPCVKGPDKLYKNLGGLKFTEITAASGIEVDGGIGAVVADFDADGNKDIYVVRGAYPYGMNVLNVGVAGGSGGGKFRDATERAGMAAKRNGISAVALDYDTDGDLDLFVANWGEDTLYRNDSATGAPAFTDATAETGLAGEGRSWAAVSADFDGDTLPDLFVCRGGPGTADRSKLYVNRAGRFEDATTAAGLSGISSMGAVVADIDGDGDMDLFATSFDGPDMLFVNDGSAKFADVTAASGITSRMSVGAASGCIDGDPLPDIVTGGFGAPSRVYLNMGGGKFRDAGVASGLGNAKKNEGVGLFDLDRDGDLDLYAANYDGRNALYRNELDGENFIRILPEGGESGFVGASARLYKKGKLVAGAQYQMVYGFCSQSPTELLFRLADAGPYDIVMVFPGGAVVKYKDVQPGDLKVAVPRKCGAAGQDTGSADERVPEAAGRENTGVSEVEK